MRNDWRSICWLLLRLGIVLLFAGPLLDSAFALDEQFQLYDAPQALGMGNAFTADAYGYTALFYNPAGLAKGESRHWEVTPIAFDVIPGLGGLGQALSQKSLGIYQLSRQLQNNSGSYSYMRLDTVPAVVYHGFGLALLGSYQFAGIYNGTQDDIECNTDVGVVTGAATNFFGNRLKIGASVKAIDRNQLPGSFTGDVSTQSMMQEGLGFGADLGVMYSLPQKYLPTFAVAWKDMFNTYFHASHLLNPHATGAPAPIPQSVNAAFSFHPVLYRDLRATFAVEYQHIESPDIIWQKKVHLGTQFLLSRSFYLWAGLNQLYPTFGMALRVKGGNLELGTYAEDIGYGTAVQSDRRIFFRYTIGF
jgi:hypothetical protein